MKRLARGSVVVWSFLGRRQSYCGSVCPAYILATAYRQVIEEVYLISYWLNNHQFKKPYSIKVGMCLSDLNGVGEAQINVFVASDETRTSTHLKVKVNNIKIVYKNKFNE